MPSVSNDSLNPFRLAITSWLKPAVANAALKSATISSIPTFVFVLVPFTVTVTGAASPTAIWNVDVPTNRPSPGRAAAPVIFATIGSSRMPITVSSDALAVIVTLPLLDVSVRGCRPADRSNGELVALVVSDLAMCQVNRCVAGS